MPNLLYIFGKQKHFAFAQNIAFNLLFLTFDFFVLSEPFAKKYINL